MPRATVGAVYEVEDASGRRFALKRVRCSSDDTHSKEALMLAALRKYGVGASQCFAAVTDDDSDHGGGKSAVVTLTGTAAMP